ncbi:MAG: ribosomal protein S18-alanine N-acetyltransferase [Pyrinomonadaceae bacterium]
MNNISPETNGELRIRSVDAANIVDLIRIADETNLSHWSAQSYLEEMKNPSSIMFRLVDENNATYGFVVGRIIPGGTIETTLEAEIYNIAVTLDEHGRGRGQMLFDAFRVVCIEQKAANIWLEVRESNANAIAFYERNGFERVQTRNHFYENPREHAILMKLPL